MAGHNLRGWGQPSIGWVLTVPLHPTGGELGRHSGLDQHAYSKTFARPSLSMIESSCDVRPGYRDLM